MRDPVVLLFTAVALMTSLTSIAQSVPPVTEVSRPVFGNLPNSREIFRIESLRAIDRQLVDGAKAAFASYDTTAPSGWKSISVPRAKAVVAGAHTLVLLRVSAESKGVEIAVRGTDNLDDVLVDLRASAEFDEALKIPIHAGFRAVAQEVHSALVENLTASELATYEFRLYGHSLGGAVASIVSMYLHDKGRKVAMVATFGAPRFTTNEGARKYQVLNQRTFRVVRCDDVVPFLPPPNFFGWTNNGYEANGSMVLLLRPPYFDFSVNQDIERDFVHQLRNELENAGSRAALAFGHRMINYKNLIEWFSESGLRSAGYPSEEKGKGVAPVSYTLAQQKELCPAQLKGPQ